MGVGSTDKSNWEKKLAGYALAGGAVMLAAKDAGATPIYSGVQNVPIGPDQTVNLNLDGNGIIDFQFQNSFRNPDQTGTHARSAHHERQRLR